MLFASRAGAPRARLGHLYASLTPAMAASVHGGNRATDAPDSPHLLAPRIKARVLVAGADRDASHPVDVNERLDEALSEAGVEHVGEIWPGPL